MSKRKRQHNGKQPNHGAVEKKEPALSPREQLRVAIDELRTSGAYLFETVLHEVQSSAFVVLEELKTRAVTLLASWKQTAKVAPANSVPHEHASNPALS